MSRPTHRIKQATAAVVEKALDKFPDEDFVEKPEGLSEGQLALLGAVGILFHLWPDQDAVSKFRIGITVGPNQICYCPNPHPPPKMMICPCP